MDSPRYPRALSTIQEGFAIPPHVHLGWDAFRDEHPTSPGNESGSSSQGSLFEGQQNFFAHRGGIFMTHDSQALSILQQVMHESKAACGEMLDLIKRRIVAFIEQAILHGEMNFSSTTEFCIKLSDKQQMTKRSLKTGWYNRLSIAVELRPPQHDGRPVGQQSPGLDSLHVKTSAGGQTSGGGNGGTYYDEWTRTYASQSDPSHPRGTADTSTAHPTVPHAPPKPTPFFAWKNIGLEVTPLMAFIATIAVVATGALVRNLLTDPDIHSRHGVEVDDKLKKVLETPGDSKTGQEEKKQSK
ncbi:uncharacterized protein JCM15063_003622 [Sporobolomyces koalae]|uniref:uncharacterized protein n=1 Tax=Sporobolomyces koalae TaxID=500713 RepID=UPI00317CD4E7